MQNLQDILDALADETISVRIGAAIPDHLWVLDLLSSADTKRSDAVYLLSADELSGLAGGETLPPAVYFVACPDGKAPDIPPEIPESATVVFVRAEMLPLYNQINRCLDALRLQARLDDIFLLAENMHDSPEQLVQSLAQMLRIGVFILNGSFQRISGQASEYSGNPYAQELLLNGVLSAKSVRTLLSGREENAILSEVLSDKWSRFYILLFWRSGARIDHLYLCRRLTDYILAFQSRDVTPDIPPFLIDQRLNRILEGKIRDAAEIGAFFGVGNAKSWFSVLTLGYEPGVRWSAEAYQRQARLLYGAFRNISVTVINAHVCAVVQLPIRRKEDAVFSRDFFNERAYNEGWDPERLERELQQCGVYLGRSSIFQDLDLFHAEFSLIFDALDIAIKLESCRGRRIVYFHDYSDYVSIKYAADRFLQVHGPDSVRAVLYPELATLLLHDIRNRTDLAETLYRYYTYGDVKSTAQSLFVHRNTVYNKLKAIQKLLGVDLDDPAVRGSYLTSLRVYYYCEKCLGIDLHMLK